MRESSPYTLELAQMRCDHNLAKSRRRRLDSSHGCEQIEIRMSAPGVAVGASRLRRFRPGRQPQVKHMPPRSKLGEVLVPESSLSHGSEQVVAKIVGALGQTLVAQDSPHDTRLFRVGKNIGEDCEKIRVLTEVFLRRGVSDEVSRGVPTRSVNRRGHLGGERAVVRSLFGAA